MSIYRRYEDPYKLEKYLEKLIEEYDENPDEDLAIEIASVKERINFAWQDDEAEIEGYE